MADHPLLSEESRALVAEVRRVAVDELDDPAGEARDAAGEFWQRGWDRCAELGLCGLPVPAELGGLGADRVTAAAVLEALGYGCSDAGLVFSVNAHLWSAVVPLWQFGSPEQRDRYLPLLCSGRWIGLHAMTEPASGSDAFSLATIARREGEDYLISGQKTLITNASNAKLLVVFARAPGTDGALGISAFLVEAGAEGVSVGAPMSKLGLRTSPLAEIALDEVRVGPEALLGREGRGAAVFSASMEWERLLIMAGQLGALDRALEEVAADLRAREGQASSAPFTLAASDKLVDVRVSLAAARALMYETAWAYDHGLEGPAPAAAVKLLAAETTLRSALDLYDLVDPLRCEDATGSARRLRDAVGAPLYSGTSQMMRRIIARSMGL